MPSSVTSTLFHAFCDSLLSLFTSALAYRVGVAFYQRLVTREGVKRKAVVQSLFSLTFAVSVSLVCLILFDAVSLMHTATRRLNWFFDVYLLLTLLILVLPIAQVYHVLVDLGLSSSRSLKVALLAELLFIYFFWRIGDPFSKSHLSDLYSLVRSQFFIASSAPFSFAAVASRISEAVMAKILIVGTTMLAILSGFTAINLPYAYLGWFLHRVSEKDVLTLEKRLAASLEDIAAEKRYVLDTEANTHDNTTTTSESGPRTIRHMPDALIAADHRTHLLFVEYNNAATALMEVKFARTLVGRLFTFLGAIMLVLCGVRIFLALYNIFARMRGARRGGRAGAQKLFDYLHLVLQSFGVHVSGQVVYQYLTLLFTSALLATNLRSALKRMSSVFSVISGHKSLSSSAPVFIAHLMGTYVISSTILIRPFLPPATRGLISDVMGNVEFQYFQNWFDVLFISSAALDVILLVYQQGTFLRSPNRRRTKTRPPSILVRQNGWSKKFAND